MRHPEGPFCSDRFDHRQHIRFAWSVLATRDTAAAAAIIADEISAFAEINAPGRYHETLTWFWIRLVAHTRAHDDETQDFDAHVRRFPILMDKRAPWKHYSAEVLESTKARREFVVADLDPIPF